MNLTVEEYTKIPIAVLKDIRAYTNESFDPIAPDEYMEVALELTKKYNTPILSQLFPTVRNYDNVFPRRSAEEIYSAYSRIQDVDKVSEELGIAPSHVVRALKKKNIDVIYVVKDINSIENNHTIADQSWQFECAVEAWLSDNGVQFDTQSELARRGCRLTPDFVMHTPIVINGRDTYWLDAKNYSSVHHISKKKDLEKIHRYNYAYGKGYYIYSMGIFDVFNDFNYGIDGRFLDNDITSYLSVMRSSPLVNDR